MEIQELEKELRDYEIGFLGLTETVAEEVRALLAERGVEVLLVAPPKQLALNYPIAKHRTAFFGCVQFRSSPEKITEVEAAMKFQKNIIRFLIIQAPAKKLQPQKKEAPAPLKTSEFKEMEKSVKPPKEILSNELLEQKLEEILQ